MKARLMTMLLVVLAVSASAALSTAAASGPPPWEGLYTTKFTGKEVSSKGQHRPKGTYTLDLNQLQIQWSEPVAGVNLTYSVLNASSNRITIAPDPNCPDTASPVTKGVYTLHLSRKTLRFKKVRDSCPTRVVDLTSHPWKKQK